MPIQSMTGYGRCEESLLTGSYAVEIKSVNNRYMEIQCRIPRLFNALEQQIRKYLSERLERGSVHFSLNWTASTQEVIIGFDDILAGKYVEILRSLGTQFSLAGDVNISDLSPFYREFITQDLAEFSTEQLWEDLFPIMEQSVEKIIAERVREGSFIVKDLLILLDSIEEALAEIEVLAPARLVRYRDRLEKVVATLNDPGVTDSRIPLEISLMVEKLDISEEVTRLKSHIEAGRMLFAENAAIGKKLGFLLQEINREINTIGSKANDSAISAVVIDMKDAAERMREQSLNLL